jgi:hypothetical protein
MKPPPKPFFHKSFNVRCSHLYVGQKVLLPLHTLTFVVGVNLNPTYLNQVQLRDPRLWDEIILVVQSAIDD